MNIPDYSRRTNQVGGPSQRWQASREDEMTFSVRGKEDIRESFLPEWHAGFGLTGSAEWMRRALGYLPEHFVGELEGVREVVLDLQDVKKINPQAPDFPESFCVHGLRYTGLPEDRTRVFFWKLNPNAIELITGINEEVGFYRMLHGVKRHGQKVEVFADIVPSGTIGREKVQEDHLFLNGRENALHLADTLHKVFYPSSSEGQLTSASAKERK